MATVLRCGGDKATAGAIDKVREAACQALLLSATSGSTSECHPAAAACLSSMGHLAAVDGAMVSDAVITLCDGAKQGSDADKSGAGAGSEGAMCGALVGVAALLQTAGAKGMATRDDSFALLSK